MLKIIKDSILENFVYENDSLEFSCSILEISLYRNEKISGSFCVNGNSEHHIEGFIITNGAGMDCTTNYFCDKESEIFYNFDANGLQEGEVLKGEISIISNCGEYELPYTVTILQRNIESSLGPIKNLFHFTNLAKENWGEAVELFYGEYFSKIFHGNDRQFYIAYRGLSHQKGNQQNVDEFLVEIHKKHAIEYGIDRQEISTKWKEPGQKEILTISRQGWGYTHLEVKSEGTFIQIEKCILTDSDFQENQYVLEMVIDENELHSGNNWGKIDIVYREKRITIPVMVQKVVERRSVEGNGRRDKKQSMQSVTRTFLGYRMNQLKNQDWFKAAERQIEKYIAQDEKEIAPNLYRVQLLLTYGKNAEAKQVLDQIETYLDGAKEKTEIWCYYLYLTTLYNQEKSYIYEIREEIESAYRRDSTNWRIAWLLLHIGEEYQINSSKKWLFLEELFVRNCRSPIVYYEAVCLLEEKPTLLMKLDNYEVQLLNFASKYNLLSKEIMGQLHYLVSRMKTFSQRVYQVLVAGYEKDSDVETLRAICSLLIKGNRTESCYFKWFESGVKEELRITLLYEYYMMSFPINFKGRIPKIILMYFAYQSNLDYKKHALLYCEVWKYREEYSEIYQSYLVNMERFALEQLEQGKINKELSILYNAVLTPKIIDPLLADQLATVLFTQLIHVKDARMKNIVIVYGKKMSESHFSIVNKVAAVPIYGSDYIILLEDAQGVRYIQESNYTVEKLMMPGKILREVIRQVHENLDLALYLSEAGGSYGTLSLENIHFAQSIVNSSEVTGKERCEFSMKLLHFYFENDCIEQLDEFLEQIHYEGLSVRERSEVVRYMIVREMYDKALRWVKQSGLEGLEAKVIVRLCSRMIAREEGVQDNGLTRIIYYAYKKGKYDENILKYLVENFDGPIKEMRSIWRAAHDFLIDTQPICERMMIQMLFTGSYIGERMSIFEDYVSKSAKVEVELAYLSKCSYDYFIKEQFMENTLWKEIEKLYYLGENLNKIIKLAYLKYYSENKEEITFEIEKIVVEFIRDMLSFNIYFSFFSQYQKCIPEILPFADQTILEYKTNPNVKVVLHYMIEGDGEYKNQYQQEVMHNMYGGIFTKSFVLFFGECLQYYITEEAERNEQLTESGTIKKNDIVSGVSENRFSIINDLAIAKAMQDYDTIDTLAREYFEKEYLAKELFHIL